MRCPLHDRSSTEMRKSICDLAMSRKCRSATSPPIIQSSRPRRQAPAIRGTGNTGTSGGKPEFNLPSRQEDFDHLAPLLGFVGDQLPEVGGRARKHRRAKVGEPRLDLGIGEAALISLFSLSMISAGVFLGAPMPSSQNSLRSRARNRRRSASQVTPPNESQWSPPTRAASRS